MSSVGELIEKYGDSLQGFSLEDSSKAIEESFNLIDDLLSDNDTVEDKMATVFSSVNDILLLCRVSVELAPFSLNVWKRYIPLLKHGNNSHAEIIVRIAQHLTNNCSNHVSSLIPAVVNIENTTTLAQSDVDSVGLILFFNQRLCATLAYFAGCLPPQVVSDNFALLLCFHGLMLHASTVIGGCVSFVEKSGEGLLKACTLRQSEPVCHELLCYHIIRDLVYKLMLPETRGTLFKHQDTCILIGVQHLTILYLRFMVECLQTAVELNDPMATLLLMLDAFLECSSLLTSFSCGLMMSDVTMMSHMSEILSLSLRLCSLVSESDPSAFGRLVEFLVENALMLDSSSHCSSVAWQVRAHQARLLLLGLLRSCTTTTQMDLCRGLWEQLLMEQLNVMDKVERLTDLSERRWRCAQQTFRAVLISVDPSCQVYLLRQLWDATAEGSRVDAVCDLLSQLPLSALYQTHHEEVTAFCQQMIEASLTSVLDLETPAAAATAAAARGVISRECAVSLLSSLSAEGVESRLSAGETNPLLERVLSRLTTDVSVGTCVVNWLNVLNEFQSQLGTKLTNASSRVVLRRAERLAAVLSVVHLLVRLLSAHKLPKGVVGVLVDCAVCCAQSSSLLWARGVSTIAGGAGAGAGAGCAAVAAEGVLMGVKAAGLAVQLTASSAVLTSEQAKKLQSCLSVLIAVGRRHNASDDHSSWKVASTVHLSLTHLGDALKSVASADVKMLVQVCRDAVRSSGVGAADNDTVANHLLSFGSSIGAASSNKRRKI